MDEIGERAKFDLFSGVVDSSLAFVCDADSVVVAWSSYLELTCGVICVDVVMAVWHAGAVSTVTAYHEEALVARGVVLLAYEPQVIGAVSIDRE